MVQVSEIAPSFTLPSNGGGNLSFPTGKPLVLYFYPKDDTPGCTTEAKGFPDLLGDFANPNSVCS